ncbi:MAG: hypothetical protein H0U64_02570 [Gemmatimonadaceae bacterium]|nr:hypothetical protein [Gemmatimonadaceae bacterium]
MKKLIAGFAVGIAACGPPPQALIVRTVNVPSTSAAPAPAPLGAPLPVDQVFIPTRPASPITQTGSAGNRRVSMTATNADVRDLLPSLASAAGVSLTMTSDVRGRISLNLRDVPAMDALRAVIEEAGLTIGTSEIPLPYGPVVFYQLPVNINAASAATIKARYAVSDSLASWIVRGRTW